MLVLGVDPADCSWSKLMLMLVVAIRSMFLKLIQLDVSPAMAARQFFWKGTPSGLLGLQWAVKPETCVSPNRCYSMLFSPMPLCRLESDLLVMPWCSRLVNHGCCCKGAMYELPSTNDFPKGCNWVATLGDPPFGAPLRMLLNPAARTEF